MAITLDGTNGINSSGVIVAPDGSASAPAITNDGDTNTGIFFPAADTTAIATGGSERVRVDPNGNMGIGVTPSAWRTTDRSIELGRVGNTLTSDNSNYIAIGTNWYISTTPANTYANTGAAARYTQTNGEHQWFGAASGTAGNAITWLERMRVTSGGQLQIGSTNSNNSQILSVQATSAGNVCGCRVHTNGNAAWSFLNASGSEQGYIQVNSSSVSYISVSDYRLKENIAPMTSALATVAQLKPCTYTWKFDGSAGQGFIAHELQEIVPDCVSGEKDAVETYTDEDGNEQTRIKPQGVDTSFLVATLTAAIQELKAELDEAKARIAALEGAQA
jgi:hypothetical protein